MAGREAFTVIRAKRGAAEQFSSEADIIPYRRFCELSGLSPKTVLRRIKDRSLPGFRIGRSYYISKADLIEFMRKGGGL